MKKVSFADMLSKNTAMIPELPTVPVYTAEQHRERLMNTALKQFEEGGSQENVKKAVFADDASFGKFTTALREFIGKLSDDELAHCRVYVTNDGACNFRFNAARDDALVLNSAYVIVLEKDVARNTPDALVLRVILNREDLSLKLQNFFQELDFHDISLKTMDQVISHMDARVGITVEQMLIGDFQDKYGSRKDWFNFSEDCYGIFDEGKLILTHVRWKRSVSLKMPINGDRPWLYHFVKNEDGSRPSANFRVNAYGTLWHKPKA